MYRSLTTSLKYLFIGLLTKTLSVFLLIQEKAKIKKGLTACYRSFNKHFVTRKKGLLSATLIRNSMPIRKSYTGMIDSYLELKN